MTKISGLRNADGCDVSPVDLQNNPAPSISYSQREVRQREEEKVWPKTFHTQSTYFPRDETGLVCLPTQLECTLLVLYW
jgi:hypothetical protein